jgi:hypothetical protein
MKVAELAWRANEALPGHVVAKYRGYSIAYGPMLKGYEIIDLDKEEVVARIATYEEVETFFKERGL